MLLIIISILKSWNLLLLHQCKKNILCIPNLIYCLYFCLTVADKGQTQYYCLVWQKQLHLWKLESTAQCSDFNLLTHYYEKLSCLQFSVYLSVSPLNCSTKSPSVVVIGLCSVFLICMLSWIASLLAAHLMITCKLYVLQYIFFPFHHEGAFFVFVCTTTLFVRLV